MRMVLQTTFATSNDDGETLIINFQLLNDDIDVVMNIVSQEIATINNHSIHFTFTSTPSDHNHDTLFPIHENIMFKRL